MKAAPFAYSRPVSVDEACELLSADESVRTIAGGQSLVPMMAMRLARPTRLVDIARIAALTYVREDKGGAVISACARQAVIGRDGLVAQHVPSLAPAIPCIGRAATRAVTLEATLSYRSGGKTGDIAARDFFTGLRVTALPASDDGLRYAVSDWRQRAAANRRGCRPARGASGVDRRRAGGAAVSHRAMK
jgi:FAD binding domain in molybdopterin dehydrogenase